MPTKTVRKGKICIEDISQGTGTLARGTSTGGSQTLNQIPIYKGTGSPEGVVTAGIGSLFFRTDGGADTSHYMKQSGSGNTGWQAIVASSGTGILTLNGLTADPQTFAVGTSGTDFAISSVTDTHTFNLPTASASNRGALSSADWSTFNAKAPTASPTFTGTVTIPTPFTLGAVSVLPTGTELNFVDGVTSSIQTQLDAKAPLASPTFTGTVTIPTPFTLGAVSVLPTGTELNFVDGVTSAIQTQLDGKAATSHAHAAADITSGTLAVAQGGTNLASGTSGGVLGYTAAGTLASSVALTASALVLGGGAGATPTPMGSLGTTTTVLHGNAAGAPTFAAVAKADAAATFVHNDQVNTGTAAMTLDMAATVATAFKPPSVAGASPGTTAAIAYDSTQTAFVAGAGATAGNGFIPKVLSVQTSTTDSIVDDTVAGTETAFTTQYTIPANFFNVAGKTLRITGGFEVVAAAGPPTLKVRFRLTDASGTQLFLHAAVAPAASATRAWCITLLLVGTGAAGASVNVHVLSQNLSYDIGRASQIASPIAMATDGALVIVPTAQWASNVANTHTVSLRGLVIEELF